MTIRGGYAWGCPSPSSTTAPASLGCGRAVISTWQRSANSIEHIAATVADEKTASVVIDLSQVSFIDSTGIASLLRGRRLADAPPKPYHITGASGLVRQVLELTGVWAHLSAPGS